MAFLKYIQGGNPGEILELNGEKTIIGRHPNCEVILDSAAVSRYHAQILESHGTFYLEDLRSRNQTLLNGYPVEGRTELSNRDQIKVCDVVFRFLLQLPSDESTSSARRGKASLNSSQDDGGGLHATLSDEVAPVQDLDSIPEPGADPGSSILSTLSAKLGTSLRLGIKPEVKLRAVMSISSDLAKTLKLDDVLHKTLDGLFRLFVQADEGFVLLKDPEKNRLTVKATKSRQARQDDSVRISMTIVRQAMKSGDAILSADAIRDKRFEMSESLSGLKIRSMMCVPLVNKSGTAVGVIQLDTKDLRQQFTQDDLDLLASVASQVTMAVENASLHEELLRQRDMERDLEFATQVQLGFLPAMRPKIPSYQFADYYEPALKVGGDYFDYIELSDSRLAISLGDVAGKGMPAALLMARMYSSARLHLITRQTAGEALSGLNAEIAASGLGHRFITLVFAILDPRAHTVTLANAGHCAPILRGPNGTTKELAIETAGLPLGIVRDTTYQEVTVPFEPGSTLVLYTDGVTESMNPANDVYGRPRLLKFVEQGPKQPEDLVNGIIDDIEAFAAERPQRDDVCLVCVQRE